jgi:DNA-binding LacI/PurR family transcriptional regulator
VLKALHERGLRLPADCSVVGRDDLLPVELIVRESTRPPGSSH